VDFVFCNASADMFSNLHLHNVGHSRISASLIYDQGPFLGYEINT